MSSLIGVKDGQIIGTPSHTPGHISLYFERVEIVITGDAAILEYNRYTMVNPQFTLNMKSTK